MAKKRTDRADWEATKAAMKWYGWGSPIGLSIFFFSLVIIIAILKAIFFG